MTDLSALTPRELLDVLWNTDEAREFVEAEIIDRMASGCPCVGTPDQEDCPHA